MPQHQCDSHACQLGDVFCYDRNNEEAQASDDIDYKAEEEWLFPERYRDID